MHIAFSEKHDGADKEVVFIHGFMGSPDQFAQLAKTVYERGCSYTSILLPGHGVPAKDFLACTLGEWENHLQSELVKLRDKYPKIYLVGHSMGGLLALNASLIRENNIAGVFMISTPLKVSLFGFKSIMARFRLLSPKNREIVAVHQKSTSVSGLSLSALLRLGKPGRQLSALIRKTKQRLRDVFVPVYMIHSRNDEVVPSKNSRQMYGGLCNTRRTALMIEKSWHAYFF